jgi:hypothetical protein
MVKLPHANFSLKNIVEIDLLVLFIEQCNEIFVIAKKQMSWF